MTADHSGHRPLIGISTYLETASWSVWSQPAAVLHHSYIEAVVRTGGVPVLLPPQEHGAHRVVAALDGLVLAGGADIDPDRYRTSPHPRTGAPQAVRDAWEFELLAAALDRDLPVLGVCRGMQVLNVALGGSLVQHLPDHLGHEGHQPARATFGRQAVRIRPRSLLGGILSGAAGVRCYHHQAVGNLGSGLLPAAWGDDETVEAIELPLHRFVVGVQWHPEANNEDLRLFQAFTTACRSDAGTGSLERRAAS